jgi:hypothetical protein
MPKQKPPNASAMMPTCAPPAASNFQGFSAAASDHQ